MFDFFARFSLRVQVSVLMALLIAVVIVAGSIVGQSIVVSQTVNESRSVADMAEHIGTWASQYGGVHIKKTGKDVANSGSFLQKSTYAASEKDQNAINWRSSGTKIEDQSEATAALGRVDTYFWKNPALIQREVSDIASHSQTNAKFRLTAKSVLNKNNAPNPFESDAIKAIDSKFGETPKETAKPRLEYWRVEGGRLLYARALIAKDSCLKCHTSLEASPDFLRTNTQFNGGGGFGYEANKPAGIISVSIALPNAKEALASSLTITGWLGLAAIFIMGLLILVFVSRKVIKPVNRLRQYADKLATTGLSDDFDVPDFGKIKGKTSNEVHLLGQAISELGSSVRILYRKVRQTREGKK
jgi:HAMP domain-containing protein